VKYNQFQNIFLPPQNNSNKYGFFLTRGPRLLEKYLPEPNITETHQRITMIARLYVANAFAVNISLDSVDLQSTSLSAILAVVTISGKFATKIPCCPKTVR
jgi:hypothetical protein